MRKYISFFAFLLLFQTSIAQFSVGVSANAVKVGGFYGEHLKSIYGSSVYAGPGVVVDYNFPDKGKLGIGISAYCNYSIPKSNTGPYSAYNTDVFTFIAITRKVSLLQAGADIRWYIAKRKPSKFNAWLLTGLGVSIARSTNNYATSLPAGYTWNAPMETKASYSFSQPYFHLGIGASYRLAKPLHLFLQAGRRFSLKDYTNDQSFFNGHFGPAPPNSHWAASIGLRYNVGKAK